MRSRALPLVLGIVIVALIALGVLYSRGMRNALAPEAPQAQASATPEPQASGAALAASGAPSPSGSPAVSGPSGAPSPQPIDLAADASGLSKATAVIKTSKGVIKLKFYSQDAPNTVRRIAELIQQGFYNGLSFHRVVPGFVIQGGDPLGNGTGGSGQRLKAEFNNRRHIEGTVAMARAADPDSADSQFYIALGTLPQLDHSYTVFGQVIEGMDVAKKIQVGDKMISVTLE